MVAGRETYQPELPLFFFSYPSLYARAQFDKVSRWLSGYDATVFLAELATDKGHQHEGNQNKHMQDLHFASILLYSRK